MSKYYEDKFTPMKNWIGEQIDNGKSEEEIQGGLLGNIDLFLQFKKSESNWEINEDDWKNLVYLEFEEARERQKVELLQKEGALLSRHEDNGFTVPKGNKTSWIKYKKLLLKKGFSRESVKAIENDSHSILKKMSDNSETGPIRGLAIGSVQSGKTTNMAALMAMASHYGWNVFIVLSGTIENLRQQTETRLYEELSQTNGNVDWDLIERPSIRHRSPKVPQALNFAGHTRYMSIVLKQKNRLEDLIDWLTSDINKMKQMKILIIDDESDQASVNTSDLAKDEERKTINNLLVNLVNGNDKKGNKLEVKYGAMNYIGYTASPYANILSEASLESLYPRDFISILSKSEEYLGPQEIFGVDGLEYNELDGQSQTEGLDIVRIIDGDGDRSEIMEISEVQNGKKLSLPNELKRSIGYFISSAASLREHQFRKPVSMLVHTSNRQNHHDNLTNAIQTWLIDSKDEVKRIAKDVWEYEKDRFTKNDFSTIHPAYGGDLANSYEKQSFEEIAETVDSILEEIAHIKQQDDGQYEYHDGVHICVDNSRHNQITEENEHIRLYYPKRESENLRTPVFLVVGGATLSRGLTLEGLITTYFLRSSGQVDTLMQMGRWFGYRKKYETYPRIWMSQNAYRQFEFISQVDYELREHIIQLNATGHNFDEVAPKILNAPSYIKLKLTSRNKSRLAIDTNFDFMGASIQTTIFDNDEEIMKANLSHTEKFINDLGDPLINFDKNRSVYWENVHYENIIEYLDKFNFNDRNRSFNNIKQFNKWVEKNSKENKLLGWNVIVVGKGEINAPDNNWVLDKFSWNKITRTRKKVNIDLPTDNLIKIQSLRGPSDLYRDINLEKVSRENPYLAEIITKGRSQDYLYVREQLNLESTPQLFIYLIDKDSKAKSNSKSREDLKAKKDIVGIYISIPGGKVNEKYSTHLTIEVESDRLNSLDLEDADDFEN